MNQIPKEWAAIDGDRIVKKEETEERLRQTIRESGENPDRYEIVALPKAHYSMVI